MLLHKLVIKTQYDSANTVRERHGMNGLGPFVSNLTDVQQTELKELMTTLRDKNATMGDRICQKAVEIR